MEGSSQPLSRRRIASLASLRAARRTVYLVVLKLRPLLTLSAEGRTFFYVSASLHVVLKVLLGLNAVVSDRYSYRSLLGPPQSVVLAAGDIGLCFAFARLLDWVAPRGKRRVIDGGLLLLLAGFLSLNFILHFYFSAFLNRGLIAFNGASRAELVDYALAGMSRYSLAFIAIAIGGAALTCYHHPRLIRSKLVSRPHLPIAIMAVDVLAMAYISQLNQGQLGFLARDPSYELVRSYLRSSALVGERASAQQARAFRDPDAPLFGNYHDDLDAAPLKRPGANVLFVLIESLPFEQTTLGRAKGGLTVLSEMAHDGIVFDNIRAVFPATTRSFLTYHCGIYPSAGLSAATQYVPDYDCQSIVPVLRRAGYRTGFFTAPMFTYDNLHRSRVAKQYDRFDDYFSLRSASRLTALDTPAVEESVVTSKLLSFVSEHPERPFFATYFMFWNHAPYRLPFEDISHLPPLARYQRTLQYLDESLRGLLRSLKERGLSENTVVIVAADHGEGFGVHHDNVNHVGHIYEDDVHVPFLIHLPGLGPHRSSRQGSNVDFAPTLASILGLPREPSWQGQDLLSPDFRSRPTLLYGRASFTTNGLVDGNYKYIEYLDGSARLLYDLASDPDEQHNLLPTNSEQADQYRSLIQRWLPAIEERSWTAKDAH